MNLQKLFALLFLIFTKDALGMNGGSQTWTHSKFLSAKEELAKQQALAVEAGQLKEQVRDCNDQLEQGEKYYKELMEENRKLKGEVNQLKSRLEPLTSNNNNKTLAPQHDTPQETVAVPNDTQDYDKSQAEKLAHLEHVNQKLSQKNIKLEEENHRLHCTVLYSMRPLYTSITQKNFDYLKQLRKSDGRLYGTMGLKKAFEHATNKNSASGA